MPALKAFFLLFFCEQMWLTPHRDLTHVRARKKITETCLYYLGMAKNFRRVLNCVALLCCEIDGMRKWPCDENRVYLEKYIPGRKNKSCGIGLGVCWGRWGINND